MNETDSAFTDTLLLTIPNTMDGFKQATGHVRECLAAWDTGPRLRYIVELAIDEMLINIVRYAYEQPGAGEITVQLERKNGGVILTLEDQGRPFDPVHAAAIPQTGDLQAARIGGRGLMMVRKMASGMTYDYRDGRNHLEITARDEAT